MRRNVLVIGNGKIGSAAARWLATYTNDSPFKVTVSDPLVEDGVNEALGITYTSKSPFDDISLLENVHYCLNLAPVYDPARVSKLVMACVLGGVHYFDISEDVHVGAAVRLIGESQTSTLVAPHCGLAPGMISILANSLAKNFAHVSEIDMRVGALPRSVSNDLSYLSNWSIDGLVNEYLNDAYIIEGGVRTTINCFLRAADAEKYMDMACIDGNYYESMPTSGGVGTMLDTWQGEANRVMYSTLRYHGHYDAFRVIGNELHWDRAALIEHMKHYRSVGPVNDLVVVFARVTGTDHNLVPGESSFGFIVKGDDRFTAIQRTTAGSLCAMVEMHHSGAIQQAGYLKQESVSWETFSGSTFGQMAMI